MVIHWKFCETWRRIMGGMLYSWRDENLIVYRLFHWTKMGFMVNQKSSHKWIEDSSIKNSIAVEGRNTLNSESQPWSASEIPLKDLWPLRFILFESNSRLTRIESEVFPDSSLQLILISRSVEILGSECFSECKSLWIKFPMDGNWIGIIFIFVTSSNLDSR
jgi:hypothetical protein